MFWCGASSVDQRTDRSLLVPCGVFDNVAVSANDRSYAMNALQLLQLLRVRLEDVAKAVHECCSWRRGVSVKQTFARKLA